MASLREKAGKLGRKLTIFCGCSDPETSPACLVADGAVKLPPVHHDEYFEVVHETCARLGISLLIPGSELELMKVAAGRGVLAEVGTRALVGGSAFISQSRDPLLLDQIACAAGAASREFVTLRDVRARPRSFDWPMDVVPRFKQDRPLGTLRLWHRQELRRIPARAPVLLAPRRRGKHYVVPVLFDENGEVAWMAALRLGKLHNNIVGFAETAKVPALVEMAGRIAAAMEEPGGSGEFTFRVGEDSSVYLENFSPVIGDIFPFIERAGSPIGASLIDSSSSHSVPANEQWIFGMRMLTYPTSMAVARP